MKKIIFISFLFLYLSNTAQNDYIPFPSEMISYGYIEHGSADNYYYSAYRAEIHGDTTFNGIPYYKYYLAEKYPDNNYVHPYPNTSGGFAHLAGGIRNDVAAKKVYLYSLSTNTEELLYDFDLKVGDTIFKNRGYGFYRSLITSYRSPVTSQLTLMDTAWVSRIDSILMPHDGLYHKRFNFNATFKMGSKEQQISSDSIIMNEVLYYRIKIDPLIEGLGIEFNPLRLRSMFESNWELFPQCISIAGKPVFSGPIVPAPFMDALLCNSIITGIHEQESPFTATLYPNPSNGKFQLITHDLKNSFFEINNVLGTTILKSKIEWDETKIDLSSQPTGIYFVRIYRNNGLLITKKIIIH